MPPDRLRNRDDPNPHDADPDSGPSVGRRRISKACESCRIRRTKCNKSGDGPCDACRENGLESSCYVREKARPNRMAYSTRRARPSMADAELLMHHNHNHGDDRGGTSSRNSPMRPVNRAPRCNPIQDIELRAQKWCVENGLSPNALLFHDEDRMATLPSTPLPTHPSALIALEDGLMRHLILSRDAENQGRIGRSQFVRLYNRYRTDPGTLADDERSVVYAVLCLAKHDTLHAFYASGAPVPGTPLSQFPTALGAGGSKGKQSMGSHGRYGHGEEGARREDVTYFRLACACLASVMRPSIYAVLSLLCLVPFAQAHGGMNESRSLLRMMAWHVRETGLHRQDVVDGLEPGEVDPAIFPMFRYMDTFMAGLDDLQPFFCNAESDVPLDIPPHVTPACQQTASMFSGIFHDDLADPTLDIRSDGYVNVAESSWAPALDDVRREKGRGRVTRVRLTWSEIRYHWLRIMLYTTRLLPPMDPSRSAQASIIIAHSTSSMIYIHHELITAGYLYPSWPQMRRLAIISQLLVILTAEGEIPAAHAGELFGKVVQVLEAHRSGWAGAAGRLLEGLRRAGLALGITIITPAPPPLTPDNAYGPAIPTPSSTGTYMPPAPLNFGPIDDPLEVDLPPHSAGLSVQPYSASSASFPTHNHHIQHQNQIPAPPPVPEVFGMFPFDPMSLFLDENMWSQEAMAGMEPAFDEAALNELLGIPMA